MQQHQAEEAQSQNLKVGYALLEACVGSRHKHRRLATSLPVNAVTRSDGHINASTASSAQSEPIKANRSRDAMYSAGILPAPVSIYAWKHALVLSAKHAHAFCLSSCQQLAEDNVLLQLTARGQGLQQTPDTHQLNPQAPLNDDELLEVQMPDGSVQYLTEAEYMAEYSSQTCLQPQNSQCSIQHFWQDQANVADQISQRDSASMPQDLSNNRAAALDHQQGSHSQPVSASYIRHTQAHNFQQHSRHPESASNISTRLGEAVEYVVTDRHGAREFDMQYEMQPISDQLDAMEHDGVAAQQAILSQMQPSQLSGEVSRQEVAIAIGKVCRVASDHITTGCLQAPGHTRDDLFTALVFLMPERKAKSMLVGERSMLPEACIHEAGDCSAAAHTPLQRHDTCYSYTEWEMENNMHLHIDSTPQIRARHTRACDLAESRCVVHSGAA